VKNEGKLYVITGIPAAGKSSSTANVLSKLYNAAVLDVDRFVEGHKDYAEGQNANYLHKDCSVLRDQLRTHLKKQGANTVWPMVGYDYGNTVARIQEFRNAGYSEIYAINVTIPKYKGVARCITRFFEGGVLSSPRT
jgi:uridine kinase